MIMSTTWTGLRDDPVLLRLKDLSGQVASLADAAKVDKARFPTLSDLDWLDRVLHRASSTFTIIVIGQVSAGKSSFINSLLGRKLLLPSDKPTDGVVSVLLSANPGEPEYAEKILKDGTAARFPGLKDAMTFLRQQDTPSEQQLLCREVRLHLHEPWLRHLRIVNTPGLGDRLQAFEKAALQYLHEDESDLVVWTFFPDAAANTAEIGLFRDALSRRRKAVIGVVTRCLEGKEEDQAYDPQRDPSLVGDGGVGQWLMRTLGQYLQEVIFYDSHVVRRLVDRMRGNPELLSDDAFVAQLERSGYSQFQRTLTSLLGSDRERVQEARAASLLKRCSGHAVSIATAAEAAEQVFLKRADSEKEQIAAWKKVERDIIGPLRARFKDEVRALAQDRSKELVIVMGNGAADAIDENFNLLGTLGRTLVSWTGLCNSAADVLNKRIGDAVDNAVSRARFFERLDDAMQLLTKEHLLMLEKDLEQAWHPGSERGSASRVPIDAGRPSGGAEDVLTDAFLGTLKGIMSAILKSVAKSIEKRAAAAAGKEAAGQATKQAATKAGEAAAKQAVQKGGGAAAAKVAGVITLVLAPFDIAKLVKDFQKGRQNLAETVRARYQADRPMYDARIFDKLWPIADKALSTVLREARASLDERKGTRARHLESAQDAAAARQSLTELAARLSERAGG